MGLLNGQPHSCPKNKLAPEGTPIHEIVEDYAKNHDTWAKDFLEAWQRMQSNGYDNLMDAPQNSWLGYYSLRNMGVEIGMPNSARHAYSICHTIYICEQINYITVFDIFLSQEMTLKASLESTSRNIPIYQLWSLLVMFLRMRGPMSVAIVDFRLAVQRIKRVFSTV